MTVVFTPSPGLKPSASSLVTLYTATTSQCIIPFVLALNVGGGTDTFTIHIVPMGVTPSDLTKITNAEPLALGERKVVDEKWYLVAGDTVQVLSSAGNTVFRTTAIENSADA